MFPVKFQINLKKDSETSLFLQFLFSLLAKDKNSRRIQELFLTHNMYYMASLSCNDTVPISTAIG